MYFVFFILLASSGINLFTMGGEMKLGLFLILLGTVLYRTRTRMNWLGIGLLVLAFSIITATQMIVFSDYDVLYNLKRPLLYYGVPICLLLILPIKFYKELLRLLSIWTGLCLLIWAITVANSDAYHFVEQLPDLLKLDPYEAKRKSIVLYTFEDHEAMGINRFAGFWHEPGAFAVLMFYALYCVVLVHGKLFCKQSIIFFIAIICTFSTTAYLALFALLFLHQILLSRAGFLSRIFILGGFAIGAAMIFTNAEFMESKIENQLESSNSKSLSGSETVGRILAFRKALYITSVHPIIGRGLAYNSIAEIDSAENTGYGWYAYVASRGLILGIIGLFLLYRGLLVYSRVYGRDKNVGRIFLVVFLIVLFSQSHLDSPLFVMLTLAPFLILNKKII